MSDKRPTLSRRELLQLAAVLGLSPSALTLGCDDGPSGDPLDSGGGDAGPLPDAGPDMASGDALPLDLGPVEDAGPDAAELDAGDLDADLDAGPDAQPVDAELPDAAHDPDAAPDPGEDDFPEYAHEGEPGPEDLFQHGVASGDPLADAVILWTRVSPASPDEGVEVWWEIARDSAFTRRVGVGTVTTDASRDFTVHVDATGLQAGARYWYRFFAQGRPSPVGRTRTAPVGPIERVNLGVCSCSHFAQGWFVAYRHLATRDDLHAVLHLGDYIYEGGGSVVRAFEPPGTIFRLDEYRQRYSSYRRDADLQAVHAAHPFIPIWDDHESVNNAWRDGADDHDDDVMPFQERRAAAEQAWAEWLPVRLQPHEPIWRGFRFGDLVDLHMLDARLWGRDAPGGADSDRVRREPDRQLLGADQEAWLFERMRQSDARWQVLGNQMMMGQLKAMGAPNSEGGGRVVNTDQWDGFVAARERLFAAARDAEARLVVVTGDIHSSWAVDLTEDPNEPSHYDRDTGRGVVGVEFITPAITSRSLPFINERLLDLIYQENPHIRWSELTLRGYFVLRVTEDRVAASWTHFNGVEDPHSPPLRGPTWATYADRPGLVEE